MKTARLSASLLPLLAASLGCEPDMTVLTNQPVERNPMLASFDSCDGLEEYIEDTAVRQMRASMTAARDAQAAYVPFFPFFWGTPMADGEATTTSDRTTAEASGASGASLQGGSQPNAYTTTNVQVAGVDEADFVKNDGTRILVLSGDTLYVTSSWPAAEMRLVGSLVLEGYPREMFLDEDNHVVVFSEMWQDYPWEDVALRGSCGPGAFMGCGYDNPNTTKITLVDIRDPRLPRVVSEHWVPGTYLNSRRVGSSVRLVTTTAFRWPQEMTWYPEDAYGQPPWVARDLWDDAMEDNERAIRRKTLEYWLAAGRQQAENGAEQELRFDCKDFSRGNGPTLMGYLAVHTFRVDRPAQAPTTSVVVGAPGEVYASRNNLYVTNRHVWWSVEPGQVDHTYIHKFDITSPGTARYLGSGGVDGSIVDQFSLDENQDGYLRVASTTTTQVAGAFWWPDSRTASRVSVMNSRLKVVGETPELAPGERIQSVRFVGHRGFVVTFRQVDPLFTFDLSDPTNPRKVGELKIPGFSTYMHPIDQDHLLTVGVFVPEDGSWSERSLQVSVFDVRDMAHPRQAHTARVGGWGASSEALTDHRAFNYFAEKGLLAIPFSDWDSGARGDDYWSRFVSDLRVFRVDVERGITPVGAVDMGDAYREAGSTSWTYYWQPEVRRSVMADDWVYAIGDVGIRAAHVDTLGNPVADVRFPRTGDDASRD
jgi:hypothetical protein